MDGSELTESEKEAINKLADKMPAHPRCNKCTGKYTPIKGMLIKIATCPKCGNDVFYE